MSKGKRRGLEEALDQSQDSIVPFTPQLQVCLGDKVPSRGNCLVVQGNQPPESIDRTPGTGPFDRVLDSWPQILDAGKE